MVRITALVLFLILTHSLYSQEPVVYKWNVSSKKIGEGKYELTFSTQGVPGWQLYSPTQSSDLSTTELSFVDSSIKPEPRFTEIGTRKLVSNPLFENVNVYEGPVEWKKVINIKGVVPGELQGNFQYTYGRGEEFYPTPFDFHVPLEGGVSSTTRIKINSIEINHPLNSCGDDTGQH